MTLNKNSKLLFDLMWNLPPDYDDIKRSINQNNMTPEEITIAAAEFIDKAREEEWEDDVLSEFIMSEPAFIESLHSAYLPELIKLLIDNGLDLILFSKQGIVLHRLLYLENGYVAADTFAILFENGFDIYADDGEEMLFDSIDFDIIFGRIEQFNRRRYDVWFHTWLVFVGYGAEPENETSPVDIVYESGENEEFGIKEFEISDFKNHRNFDFAISYIKNKGERKTIIIFDKRTRYEVARL